MDLSSSTSSELINRLFRRCVECPDGQPQCPSCDSDETCSLTPASCNACASTTCVKLNTIAGQSQATKSSTPIGGIVGGVVGGVIAIVLLTYLVWRFCIRKKKRQDLWEPPEKYTLGRSGTMLSRTHSIASTVMTRASNVIQIAYIPGVTVRSAPESPEIAPPMPSIPSTYGGGTSTTQNSPDLEQHFFMPRDLRDSVWSDTSSVMTDQRVSIAPSLARASVATTIYPGETEVPPVPAQYAYIAQANTVSLRSGSTTPSIGQHDSVTPPVPHMPKAINLNGSSIVARNVVARPIQVKKSSSSNSVPTLANLARKSPSRRPTPVPTISDEKEVVFGSPTSTTFSESPLAPPQGRDPQSSFISTDAPSASGISAVLPAEGPLGSANAPSGRPTTAYTKAMITEAMMRAVQDTSHAGSNRPSLRKKSSGPFSDSNEIPDGTI